MTNQGKILEFLKTHTGFYCDDCLAELCKIQPRQTVFSVCSKLAKSNQIVRKKGICDYCSRQIDKNVSSFDSISEKIVGTHEPKRGADKPAAQNIAENTRKQNAFQKLELVPFIEAFIKLLSGGSIEIYNEFSLQHELGIYLRDVLPKQYKVQFERNVSFFDLDKSGFEKKEMDLVIFNENKQEKYCVELKYPMNGQYPEEMFSFVKDVKFLEQLKDAGFSGCCSLVVINEKPFYQGGNHSGIYRIFRETHCISGTIQKPTANRDHVSVFINGSYPFTWKQINQNKMYYCIVM